ncbi:putative ATPase [Paraburkholderia unamae]|uniref:ATP-binding protein n=1 Tax=Paraburkholderia unamae TaxID=219649 RepID=UPI000DC37C5E|nr:winged helix-turn-helix domain-containing protein [Paraburkholderia unamae]RAR67911.1 putative ATPase [Paraburkholderia unamae]
MTGPSDLPEVFSFGQTVVVLSRRELTHAGMRVEIGGRAFDLLLALIGARGTPVSRDSLRSKVWAGRVIEENTVEARISIIRRALGDDRDAITTIEGRGYQFVAEITPLEPDFLGLDRPSSLRTAPAARHSATLASSPLVGRECELSALTELVGNHRLVTLTGPGGVGKTRLAFEAARVLTPRFTGGVLYSELGSIVVATAALFDGIEDDFSSGPQLLILDNCEHLVDSVANAIERFLNNAPHLTIIATSREALRISGESMFKVEPLEIPTHHNLADARTFSAFQMLEHLIPSGIQDAEISAAVELCRRLDGIPLALELASACIPALGLAGVAAQLDDRFTLLTRGARTAVPRHQTLLATLDWSYALLDAKQRSILERVSLFAGHFTLAGAQYIATDDSITAQDVLTGIVDLEKRSLICTSTSTTGKNFRLLETTRAYAQMRFRERDDFCTYARAHARYVLATLTEPPSDTATLLPVSSKNEAVAILNDLKAAVARELGSCADANLAVDLVIASVGVLMRASMFDECIELIERTRGAVEMQTGGQAGLASKLSAARGICLSRKAGGS